MQRENKVLYWFRDNLNLKNHANFLWSLSNCTSLIPVYCFDPREPGFYSSDKERYEYFAALGGMVQQLRSDLRYKASDLLIVNECYERIIPSLARVLDVNLVVTDPFPSTPPGLPVEIVNLRKEKTKEIVYLLNMHSIVAKSEVENAGSSIPDIFPCFPEINPGTIPEPYQPLLRAKGRQSYASN